MILRALQVLTGFITAGNSLNNMRYTDDAILIPGTKRNCIVVNTRNSRTLRFQIEYTKIKHVPQFILMVYVS